MTSTRLRKVIDGDGHVFEDAEQLASFLPSEYRDAIFAAGFPGIFGLVPHLDNLHTLMYTSPPGSFIDPGVDGWVKFLDDLGITASVLYPTAALSFGRIVDHNWAILIARAYNDWLYENYLKRDSRFQGVGLIPMQDPEAAVVELRRVVTELGMCGAMLPATGLKTHLGAKDYWPIYQEADRLGCCLSAHGGCHSGLGFDTLNVFAAIHALGHPFAISINFVSMLFNGIFDRFPNVRFGFLEASVAWLLLAMERSEGSYKGFIPLDPRGEYLQLKPGETVTDHILRHIRAGRIFVGIEGGEPELAYAVKKIGNDPFIFSSDFPHEVNIDICKHEIEELWENEGLTEEDKEAILYKNAERFYNFQPVSV